MNPIENKRINYYFFFENVNKQKICELVKKLKPLN